MRLRHAGHPSGRLPNRRPTFAGTTPAERRTRSPAHARHRVERSARGPVSAVIFLLLCNSNIQMTPLSKIEMTLRLVLGDREERHGGGVDERSRGRAAIGFVRRPLRTVADFGCMRVAVPAASPGVPSA